MPTFEPIIPGKGEPIRVSSLSHAYPVAAEIAHLVRTQGKAEIQAMGTGAVDQAIKAISIAYGYLWSDGIEIVWKSEIADIVNREYMWTATRFIVEPRSSAQC
jgi:stage V sporulation protein S